MRYFKIEYSGPDYIEAEDEDEARAIALEQVDVTIAEDVDE